MKPATAETYMAVPVRWMEAMGGMGRAARVRPAV